MKWNEQLKQPVVIRKETLQAYVNVLVQDMGLSEESKKEYIDGLWVFDVLEYRQEDVVQYVNWIRRKIERMQFWYGDAMHCSAEEQMDKHKGDLAEMTIRDGRWTARIQELDLVLKLLRYLAYDCDFTEIKATMR